MIADPLIRIRQRLERNVVERAACRRSIVRVMRRKRALLEHLAPRPLRMDRTAIHQNPHAGLRILIRQHVQLLLRAVVLPRKAQQLKQERAALGVERL